MEQISDRIYPFNVCRALNVAFACRIFLRSIFLHVVSKTPSRTFKMRRDEEMNRVLARKKTHRFVFPSESRVDRRTFACGVFFRSDWKRAAFAWRKKAGVVLVFHLVCIPRVTHSPASSTRYVTVSTSFEAANGLNREKKHQKNPTDYLHGCPVAMMAAAAAACIWVRSCAGSRSKAPFDRPRVGRLPRKRAYVPNRAASR